MAGTVNSYGEPQVVGSERRQTVNFTVNSGGTISIPVGFARVRSIIGNGIAQANISNLNTPLGQGGATQIDLTGLANATTYEAEVIGL